MIVVPAMDLRGGKCVSMRQGDPDRQTSYDDDPVSRAKSFARQGAQRLHVIDLDGALGNGENEAAIAQICKAVDVPVETGGGIRNLESAQRRLDAGASYVILGTLLVEDERVSRNIIGKLGERVVAGIDARGETVAVRGWQSATVVNRDALIKRVAVWGVTRMIHTEIGREGTGEGFDIAALSTIAGLTEMKITASGGAHNLDDLKKLKGAVPGNVDSCVVGRALYEGSLDLAEAIKAVA
ncbi:MAG: 1-(5-phosphoribosyl)-5-((5-phosphoribosylamino)methylideneamino)imidazole-4-carboxamide isomerase [Candidatus Meridianibacter frigidus]|nr:MAG: 1-(5-phosphoribosyl)-5-((5-phosphoribosylamino)methylideneamino)imidazole-4-carboxamide isomerase [Candidatus Eremiobacteraeota bacterium]